MTTDQKTPVLVSGTQTTGVLWRVCAPTVIACIVAASAASQTARDTHGAAAVLPLQNEPPAKIFVDPPPVQPLSVGTAVVQYRTEHLRIVPVFGAAALAVSPRVGHVHVGVDDAPWVWAHTSAEPAIVAGLDTGRHKIRVQLMTANHQQLDEAVVKFTVPEGDRPASTTTHTTRQVQRTAVLPLSDQAPARIMIDSPLAEPLSRGVVFIRYRAENLHIVPVFGSAALAVSPRIGHIHVTVDKAPWHWVDTSGNPVIIQGLAPGQHKISIDLANADDHILDKGTVEVTIADPN